MLLGAHFQTFSDLTSSLQSASAGFAKRKQSAGVPEPIRVLNSYTNGVFVVRAPMDSLVMFHSCQSSIRSLGRGSRIPPTRGVRALM